LGVNVLVVNIYLAKLDFSEKITYKVVLGLEEYNKLIQLFKDGHDTREPHHYFKVANYG
jgi:uncharacterized protein YjbK